MYFTATAHLIGGQSQAGAATAVTPSCERKSCLRSPGQSLAIHTPRKGLSLLVPNVSHPPSPSQTLPEPRGVSAARNVVERLGKQHQLQRLGLDGGGGGRGGGEHIRHAFLPLSLNISGPSHAGGVFLTSGCTHHACVFVGSDSGTGAPGQSWLLQNPGPGGSASLSLWDATQMQMPGEHLASLPQVRGHAWPAEMSILVNNLTDT